MPGVLSLLQNDLFPVAFAFVQAGGGCLWSAYPFWAVMAPLNSLLRTLISCASAGNCSAGGYYSLCPDNEQAFVVNEVKGIWQKAEELPGTAALNRGGFAEIYQISCVAAGNCAAGGFYTDRSGSDRAFVANEERGTWRKIETLPGTGSGAAVYSLSCPSVGHCSAGGGYNGHPEKDQAFVVNETS